MVSFDFWFLLKSGCNGEFVVGGVIGFLVRGFFWGSFRFDFFFGVVWVYRVWFRVDRRFFGVSWICRFR